MSRTLGERELDELLREARLPAEERWRWLTRAVRFVMAAAPPETLAIYRREASGGGASG